MIRICGLFFILNFYLRSIFLYFFWRNNPQWARNFSFFRILDHTQRHTTVGRTLLFEGSARRRNIYLTTHNTHNRQTSMPSVRFEPTISGDERPQTYALDRAATGTGYVRAHLHLYLFVIHYYPVVKLIKIIQLNTLYMNT